MQSSSITRNVVSRQVANQFARPVIACHAGGALLVQNRDVAIANFAIIRNFTGGDGMQDLVDALVRASDRLRDPLALPIK